MCSGISVKFSPGEVNPDTGLTMPYITIGSPSESDLKTLIEIKRKLELKGVKFVYEY